MTDPVDQDAQVIGRMRDIARRLGWAIGAHGSRQRDLDFIAVPWTAEAVPWRDLYAALVAEVPLWDTEGSRLGHCRGPHGRIKVLALQPGAERASDHPKGHWDPKAIDLSIVDSRDVAPSSSPRTLPAHFADPGDDHGHRVGG